MTLPETLLDLQFDSIILPMDAKVAEKFDAKFREHSIMKIDAQELLDAFNSFGGICSRTVIFVRPFSSEEPPEMYQRALRAMIEQNLPHIEITDVVFDELLANCIEEQSQYNESSAELEHLDKKLIENHFEQLIQPSFEMPNFELNASVNTFVLAVEDAGHRYAPRYSDQLKTTTKPVEMHEIVPVEFFEASTFYSPVELLPPACDDPANPYFYINDCKYMYNYRDQPGFVPCPRLIINGFGLLPAGEGIMKKNEDLVRTSEDLAYVYASLENGFYLATHALCGIFYQNIGHLQYLVKLLEEELEIVKSGKIEYRKEDFLVNLVSSTKFQLLENLDEFEEPVLDLKEIFKGEETEFKVFMKQTVTIYESTIDSLINGYFPEVMNPKVKKESVSAAEKEYLRKTMAVDAVELEFVCFSFLEKISVGGEMDPRVMLDWDEFGVVLATNLRVIIFKCLLSGFFNRKLLCNRALYQSMNYVELLYNSPLSKMRMDLKEFNRLFSETQQKYTSESSSLPISAYVVELVFEALNDPIVIRPENQPDIRDSVLIVYKNGRNFLSNDYIQLYCELLRINKKLKDRDPPAISTKENINYYIPVATNEFDGQYEETETPEDRIKQSKLAEDITSGKCAICQNTPQCMYNNYREHIESQFHRERYKQQLESIYETLMDESEETAQLCREREEMSVLCELLSQRTNQPFAACARHINIVLENLRLYNLLVDADEEPRSNSPTCRTEEFGKWRESVLRERFEEYEQKLFESDEQREEMEDEEAKLDSITIACAWQVYRKGVDSAIIESALLDIIRKYGSLDDVMEAEMLFKRDISNEFVPLADVEKVEFTGVNDIVDHRDLYSELISRIAQNEEDGDTATLDERGDEDGEYVSSFPALTRDEFDVFEDYAEHELNLLLSPEEDLEFEQLFFKTVDEIASEQDTEHKCAERFMTVVDVKDLRKTVTKYENGVPYSSASFKDILENVSFMNNSELADILTKEEKMYFCSNKLLIPPFYKRNPDYISSQRLVDIAQRVRTDKECGITLEELLHTCREYSSDLSIILDFIENDIHFEYETSDDWRVQYSEFSTELKQDKSKYESNGLEEKYNAVFDIPNVQMRQHVSKYPTLIRNNSFDGELSEYCATALAESESSSLNRLLTTDLPRDDLNWPEQARECSDDNDFSVSLTEIEGGPAPPVETFETSKDCWNDIIRGFDFIGDAPTLQNVNPQVLEAIAALVETQTGFSHISEVANFAYDGAVCGCLTGMEHLDVIYGSAAARMSESSERPYEEAQSGSFTVERRIVGSGLFG